MSLHYVIRFKSWQQSPLKGMFCNCNWLQNLIVYLHFTWIIIYINRYSESQYIGCHLELRSSKRVSFASLRLNTSCSRHVWKHVVKSCVSLYYLQQLLSSSSLSAAKDKYYICKLGIFLWFHVYPKNPSIYMWWLLWTLKDLENRNN